VADFDRDVIDRAVLACVIGGRAPGALTKIWRAEVQLAELRSLTAKLTGQPPTEPVPHPEPKPPSPTPLARVPEIGTIGAPRGG
jgi:hypothetical protein